MITPMTPQDAMAARVAVLPPESEVPTIEIKIKQITVAELDRARISPRQIVPKYIYADVRMLIAAGGTGKTTEQLYEAVTLAVGRPLFGRLAPDLVRTVLVTREDSRETLLGRLREVIKAEELMPEELARVFENIFIIDLSGEVFRLSTIAGDLVYPNMPAIVALVDVLKEFKPDRIIFDPLVSFGVGESRVNDAEQGLIEAFRIIRNQLDCCVEGIHHTGKAAAREKAADQYAGRGGSALADGSRMVAVLNNLTPAEWLKLTGIPLEDKATGLVMALPKLSYCEPLAPIYIQRTGYKFKAIDGIIRDPAQTKIAITNQVYQYLLSQYKENKKYSKKDLEQRAEEISLTRNEIRIAQLDLIQEGRVLYHEVKGKSGSYFEPLILATLGGTPKKEGNFQ